VAIAQMARGLLLSLSQDPDFEQEMSA